MPSHFPLALPLLPRGDSLTRDEPHSLGLVDVQPGLYGMSLSEAVISAPNAWLMDIHKPGAAREGDSASQQLVLSRIPAFSYNYTQRWVVRTTLTHGLGHS